MRLALWWGLRFLPRAIQELPYRFGFLLLRSRFRRVCPDGTIGYRNSLDLHRIEPALSDLDITMVTDERDRDRAIALFNSTKRFVPFLGELNLYLKDQLSETRELLNSCERERDPLFRTKTPPTQTDAIVFIARMLEADRAGLATRPRTRQKKWRGHFDDLGWKRPAFIDRKFVSQTLSEKLGYPDAARVIEAFFAHEGPSHLFTEIDHPLIQTLFFHRVCYRPPNPQLRPLELDVIRAQQRWELWASRIVPSLDAGSWTPHLANMANFIAAAERP